MLSTFGWNDIADLALAIFLILAGLSLAYALWKLGATLARATTFIKGTERELLPVINKLGGTIERVNDQLDKVDRMTDSAVDAVQNVDAAVRTVSAAVRRPVQKLAGVAAGVRHGASSVRSGHDWREAVRIAKE